MTIKTLNRGSMKKPIKQFDTAFEDRVRHIVVPNLVDKFLSTNIELTVYLKGGVLLLDHFQELMQVPEFDGCSISKDGQFMLSFKLTPSRPLRKQSNTKGG